MRHEESNDRTLALQALKKKRDAFESAMRLIEEADSDVVSVLRSAWLSSQGDSGAMPTATPSNGSAEANVSVLTLLEAVRQAVERSPSEMTVRTIFDDLAERGYESRAKKPKASIAFYLRKMVDDGKLRVVRLGSGSRNPSVYGKV